MKPTNSSPTHFGTLLGVAPGGVAAYSSHYPSADPKQYPTRQDFRSYVDGVFMGYKWQCVEFARRWLYLNHGAIFDDVAMAYDIFGLRSLKRLRDGAQLPLHAFRNGSLRHPQPGALLIWSAGGEFEQTGHVAVVVEVTDDYVRVAEQNVEHQLWQADCSWSRQIPAKIDADGGYWLRCSFGDATILGWMLSSDDSSHAEPASEPDPALFNLISIAHTPQQRDRWLNTANDDEAAYVRALGSHRLAQRDNDSQRYICLSRSAERQLQRATNELHALFMHATNHVLQQDEVLKRFNLPEAIWPRIRQSWSNRRNQMITGRFDFAMTPAGLKVYEYNADSASCHMECGKVQGKWAESHGVNEGQDPGASLFPALVKAWQQSDVNGVLHLLIDDDDEERYHALFMREAMQQSGIRCKILTGLEQLHWGANGSIDDDDGEPVRWVWKSWAWETALDQLRAECEQDQNRLQHYSLDTMPYSRPRLVDVLLRKEVMVYEPLWTLIPSNKAILPVLWELFPENPFLLESHFALQPNLQEQGYVRKPIAGRCGHNISLVHNDTLLHATSGAFDHQDDIYQALFMLPKLDDLYVQLCSFTAGGYYAGSCVRADTSAVITRDSGVLPMRIIDDAALLRLL